MKRCAVLVAVVLALCAVPLKRVGAEGSGPLTLSVSDFGGQTCEGGTPANMTDGDYGTKYTCTPSSDWWVVLDAGEGVVMAEVKVLPAFAADCGIKVDYSEDGGEWVHLYNGWNLPGNPLTKNHWTSYVVPPVRYVRLGDVDHDKGCSNPGTWSMYEVEAYGPEYLGLTLPVGQVGRYAEEFTAGIVGDYIELSIGIVIVGLVIGTVVKSVRRMGGKVARPGRRLGRSGGVVFREPGDMS